jgi:hypothetical protein
MWRRDRHKRIALGVLALAALTTLMALSPVSAAPDTNFEIVTPLQNKDSGKNETSVGDLVTDAVRAVLGTDAAFVASSELKPRDEAIPAGQTSSGILAGLVSYSDDPLAVVELTGAKVRSALERAVGIHPQPSMSFLQVSGIQFRFDASAPVGRRVVSVTIAGKPVADEARYTVGMTNSLANGALGYWKVWSQDSIKKKLPDVTLIKALEAYLKDNPKVDYPKADRISNRSR